MKKKSLLLTVAVSAVSLAMPIGSQVAQASPVAAPIDHHLCSQAGPGQAACMSIRLENNRGQNVDRRGHALAGRQLARPMDADSPTGGLSPADIQSAYSIKGAQSHGRTVAIVDAYGYSNAEADLAQYRQQYNLPDCTTDNGCLTVMNQDGDTDSYNLPEDNDGWDGEQALDLDAVSATCPDCKILLVQANSASMNDLATAVNTAAKQAGVVAISNSYSGGDGPDSELGAAYHHPGIALTASTGDSGYQGGGYPASSGYVTAVGGTTLVPDHSSDRGWRESAWSGAGSGCSPQNQAPAGQSQSVTHCSGRAASDVSAVADPQSGLATYGPGGWGIVGGTSLSAPVIAAMYALSGNTQGMANALPYAHQGSFNDVTDGSNGDCANWCAAGTGWDGPTGLGSPNGLAGL